MRVHHETTDSYIRVSLTRIIAVALAALALAAVGAVLFAWSGLYSVAASEGHLVIVDKFLRFGMQSSVRTQARNIEPPDLSDPNLVTLGAAHYYSGCMPCHGAPGHAGNAVFQQSLPPPPDLRELPARHGVIANLFWLVKHGLKYTGMPGWSARGRNDEQWAVVAFLKRLPQLSSNEFEALALGGFPKDRVANDEPSKTFGVDIAQCARCHGDARSSPTSTHVPRLAGQSEAYLRQALTDYAAGARQSGIMQPIASTLSPGQISAYATYYAKAAARRMRPNGKHRGPAQTSPSKATSRERSRLARAAMALRGTRAIQALPASLQLTLLRSCGFGATGRHDPAPSRPSWRRLRQDCRTRRSMRWPRIIPLPPKRDPP